MKTFYEKILAGFCIFFVAGALSGQEIPTTITGRILDETGAPLPEATIKVMSTDEQTIADADGNFEIAAPQGNQTLTIDFIGLPTLRKQLEVHQGKNDLGLLVLNSDENQVEEVVVIGKGVIDVATGRATPIAVSTITAAEIQAKAGNQEFPEIMKNTPSVYVTKQAAGYGDGDVRLRGFDQSNTAYLINGQPINGMEDNKIYWSNWQGVLDIASAVQVQRGLGASKLAISSVGGTTNIVTKATDMRQNGHIKGLVGNNGYWKATGFMSTGLSNGTTGFGTSVMLSTWRGDGYMDGTRGEGQTYFISMGYRPNEKHAFNFLVTGAPQKHDQAYNQTLSTYEKYGKLYNPNAGYNYNGDDYKSIRTNYYHKPITNLNWDWDINDKAALSTVLYASWGRGGGTGPANASYAKTAEGYVDWETTVNNNNGIAYSDNGYTGDNYAYTSYKDPTGTSIPRQGTAMRASVNNHQWYGMVSNFNYALDDHWEFNLGIDGRYYNGVHYQKIVDLLELDGYVENANVNYPANSGGLLVTEVQKPDPWNALTDNPDHEQRISYDYSEIIKYGGFFGQLEYKQDYFTAFTQAAISNQWHNRTDYFQYTSGNQRAEDISNIGYNLKGGFSIKPTQQHVLFVNAGYYSKQPIQDELYLNFGNTVNPLTKNEKVLGLEGGYRFISKLFDANVNVYHTNWKDRTTTTSYVDPNTDEVFYNQNSGVDQLHKGIEFDFLARMHRMVDLKGFLSFGNWKYNDDVATKTFDENQNLVSESMRNIKGEHVGGSAQTTAGAGLVFKPIKGLLFDVDWRYYSRLYADVVNETIPELPSYNLLDVGLGYDISLEGDAFKAIGFRVNVNNVLDETYLSTITRLGSSATDYYQDTYIPMDSSGMYGLGRTWNAAFTLKF